MQINSVTPYDKNFPQIQSFTGHTQAEGFYQKGIRYLAHQTAFFREPVTLERVKRYIIKNFSDKKEINILVGACSTGEEAYTLSMLLNGLKSKVNIIGFDVSKNTVNQARKGKVLMQTSIVETEREMFLKDSYLVFSNKNDLTKQQNDYKQMFDENFVPIKGKYFRIYNNIKRFFTDLNPNIGRRSRYFQIKDGHIQNCRFVEGDIRELDKLDAPEKVDVLFFRNAFYHLLNTCRNEEQQEKVLTQIISGVRNKLGKNGIFVNGEDDGIQISNYTLIPRVMIKMGFEPINLTIEGTASIWKKLDLDDIDVVTTVFA